MMFLNQMQVASTWDKFGTDLLFDILASVVSVPSLASLVGLGLVIAGIVGILKTRRFLATAVSAPGVVTKNIVEEVPSSDESYGGPYDRFTPCIRFHTTAGEEISFINSSGTGSPLYHEYQEVTVVYDPQEPDHAYIRSFRELWAKPVLLVCLGIGCFLKAVLF